METRLRITGMYCGNCKARIERKLRGMKGVSRAEVSLASGVLVLEFDPGTVGEETIIKAVNSLGYGASKGRGALGKLSAVAAAAFLYVLMTKFGTLDSLVPSQLAESGMGFAMLFFTGLLTSVHCVAMCGGINLSQSLPRGDPSSGGAPAFAPAVLYNVGRVLSYAASGALLGTVGYLMGTGAGTGFSPTAQGALKLAAGAYMALMGAGMMGLSPLPRVGLPFAGRIFSRVGARAPFAVGLLNGLMPCGPLQTVQLIALTSGGPFAGAAVMLSFGLGTVPLMLGFGALVSALGRRFRSAVHSVGAVLLAVMGLAMAAQGCALMGLDADALVPLFAAAVCACAVLRSAGKRAFFIGAPIAALACAFAFFAFGLPRRAAEPIAEAVSAAPEAEKIAERPAEGEVQSVNSLLLPNRYPNIELKAGVPARWNVTVPRGSLNMCNFRMMIREFGIVHTFSEGENVIELAPKEPGTYVYSCWMGMQRGAIRVR